VAQGEDIGKLKKCISEECFRWAMVVCMDAKREYWRCFNQCLRIHTVNPELMPTEDKCHEVCREKVVRNFNFLTKDALMDCIIL